MKRNSNEPGTKDGIEIAPRSKSPILRGAFVHRMGENAEDERAAAEFWRKHGFAVENLEDPSERFSRRPDLRLLRDDAAWAYCEVKTVWHHRWKVHILHDDGEEVRTEWTEKSVEKRIAGDLVTAERQLRAENPDHTLLNFVLLINRDSAASFSVLSSVLTSPPPQPRRGLKARHDEMLGEEIQRFRSTVDLCLWANSAEDGKLLIEGCYLFNPNLRSFAEEITELRGDRVISLEPAA